MHESRNRNSLRGNNMPNGHQARKGVLAFKGITITAVAEAANCSVTTASRVIGGERIDNPAGQRVMSVVSKLTGLSVTELWPETRDAA